MQNLLLICNRPAINVNAATITDHIDAICAMPGIRVHVLSTIGRIPAQLDLNRYDIVAIHYTLHLSEPGDYFLSAHSMKRISDFDGLKCIWLHDEYRRVRRVSEKLAAMKIDVIFTLADSTLRRILYPVDILPDVEIQTVYGGYVPDHWLDQEPTPLQERTIDVGYRARRPPFWLGQLGQDKIQIGTGFVAAARGSGLNLDISIEEKDRLYGRKWEEFLSNCRTVLCVESGSSIIDFGGEIEKSVDAAVAQSPKADFITIADKWFPADDQKYLLNPVSSRVFEAAAMKTVMVAFEGEYCCTISR